ncbi:hypothetical protein PoB_000190800 [Plakobranchus ocellatus]|uniref:Uncharacterized protein n=1 Tax=Plakobranchus ocellatus TaxID=259542 RepID=A0AAV3XYX4_9GAST|nr:hypothetical protein PoB_000190800 [Plakobranchus ocellatus]
MVLRKCFPSFCIFYFSDFSDFDYEDSTIVMKPEFLNTETNITVTEGRMAILPCSVRYLGTKESFVYALHFRTYLLTNKLVQPSVLQAHSVDQQMVYQSRLLSSGLGDLTMISLGDFNAAFGSRHEHPALLEPQTVRQLKK